MREINRVGKNYRLWIGHDFMTGARLRIEFGYGLIPDAPEGCVCWRHFWIWSSGSLPYFIRSGRRKIIGLCAFGRCWVWRDSGRPV